MFLPDEIETILLFSPCFVDACLLSLEFQLYLEARMLEIEKKNKI